MSFTGSKTNKISPGDPFGSKTSVNVELSHDRRIHVVNYKPHSHALQLPLEPVDEQNAVVVFFIHGVGECLRVWIDQMNFLSGNGYEVIAFDILGHGLSSKPRDQVAYEFQELANDVLSIFDKFSKRRNVVVGHSYGAAFCTLLAHERAQWISKVVLISGGGPTPLSPDRCSAFCLPTSMFQCVRPSLVKMYRKFAFHKDASEDVRNKVTTFGIPSYALKAVMQGQHWYESGEEYHAQLSVPVLLIYGRGDRFVDLEEEEWMNETVYGSHLEVVEDAGHMVMIEAPDRVNELLLNFLNRDSSTRSQATRSQATRSVSSISLETDSPYPQELAIKLSEAPSSRKQRPSDVPPLVLPDDTNTLSPRRWPAAIAATVRPSSSSTRGPSLTRRPVSRTGSMVSSRTSVRRQASNGAVT